MAKAPDPASGPARYARYLKERDGLIANGFATSRDFDKWTLTVAGASLGVTFSFLKDVVPLATAQALWLASHGWLALGLAVAALLVALKCGHEAHESFRHYLDESAAKGCDEMLFRRAREMQIKCPYARATEKLRWSGLALTVVGILFLMLFVWVNL